MRGVSHIVSIQAKGFFKCAPLESIPGWDETPQNPWIILALLVPNVIPKCLNFESKNGAPVPF